jgi:P27 family predicted phage terminase small subunit
MSIRGPKPTPGNLRVLKGRDHHKKKDTVRVPPADDLRLLEKTLTTLPEDVRERARVSLEILTDKKVLGGCDIESFARYCQHLRLGYEANELLKHEGLISYDDRGIPHKHPAFQMHRDSSLAALRYEEQFGLTPSARMRLTKTDEEQKEDDYGEFRKRAAAG